MTSRSTTRQGVSGEVLDRKRAIFWFIKQGTFRSSRAQTTLETASGTPIPLPAAEENPRSRTGGTP